MTELHPSLSPAEILGASTSHLHGAKVLGGSAEEGTQLSSAALLRSNARFEPVPMTSKKTNASRNPKEAFLDTKECFRRCFEDAGNGMALVSLDGHLLRVNRAFCEIVGYSMEEMLSKNFQDITHPDDRELSRERLQSALAENKLNFKLEKRYFHRDGHVVWVRITASFIRDSKGSPQHLLSQIEDVTAHQQAQQALRESEERFRLLAACAPLGIFLADRQGNVIYTNPKCQEITGLTLDDSQGEKWKKWLHPDDREKVLKAWNLAITQGSDFHQEIRVKAPVGGNYWVQGDMVPIRDSAGKVASYVGTNVDITEIKKLQQKLMEQNSALCAETARAQEANVLKSRFLAHMSHELRTPLNGIIGFSELLYDQLPGGLNSQQLDFLNDVLNSARHLLQLINDLLDLSKIEAGRMDIIPKRFSLREPIDEVSAILHPLMERKDLSYLIDLQMDGQEEVVLDRQKISQVLYNLLSNAIKFTPEKGRITLRVAPHAEGFQLTVSDTGIGIQAENLERLFCEFEQFEIAGVQRQGSGLGLMLTKKLVTLLQGTIRAESTFGHGTTFFVVLPRSIQTKKSS